jgi:hypothetical protein
MIDLQTADTDVLPRIDGSTQNLTEHARRLPPTGFLRRPDAGTGRHATGEVPVWPTGAERAVGFLPPVGPQPRPGPPPTPPPGPPVPPPVSDDPPVTERLTLDVRPKHFHARHRRPLPLPALLTACFGAGGMGGVSVLAVAVAVAQ